MARSATDRTVEAAMSALSTPAAERPLQTPPVVVNPVVVYLRPASVAAIAGALNQAHSALSGRDEHLRKMWGQMKTVRDDCAEVAQSILAALRLTPDHLGLTQAAIERHRALLATASALVDQVDAATKTPYAKKRYAACRAAIVTATQLLDKPPAGTLGKKRAKAAAKPKAATKSPSPKSRR